MRFFVLLFFVFTQLQSQTISDTLRLFFGINEVSTQQNNFRADSFLNIREGRALQIKIIGYADYLHKTDYNLSLSQKRADAVKAHILARNFPGLQVLECTGKGEIFSKENPSKEGEPFQRRVDVITAYSVPAVAVPAVKETEPEEKNDTSEIQKKIESLSEGQSLAIEGLSFEPGRHVLLKSSVPVLQKLLKTLKDNPALKIAIEGHVCCIENHYDGMDIDTGERKLSVNRAKAVRDYLVKNGIAASRLSYEGFGRSRPKFYPEDTPEKEQGNRRVEIRVLAK